MKFTEEQLNSIRRESGFYKADEEFIEVELIEEGDWSDDGKFSSAEYIFKLDGKFYSFHAYRSGSYFTEYHYEYDTDVTEVEQVTETITVKKWVQV